MIFQNGFNIATIKRVLWKAINCSLFRLTTQHQPVIIQMYATIYSTVIIIYILFQILRIISQSWKEMKMASTRRKENFQL